MGLRVPANVSSITFVVSGAKVPVSRIVSGLTALEETAATTPRAGRSVYVISTNPTTGAGTIQFPPGLLTTLTIAGNVTAVNGAGVSASVPAAALTDFIGATDFEPFQAAAS